LRNVNLEAKHWLKLLVEIGQPSRSMANIVHWPIWYHFPYKDNICRDNSLPISSKLSPAIYPS